MIGYVAIVLALLCTCIAGFSYFYSQWLGTRRSPKKGDTRNVGVICYRLSAVAIGVAASYLLYLILDNRFEYAYVFNYSSRELSLSYKIASFWAGQQGSFLLWLVFHTVFGLFLGRKKQALPGVMMVYCILQAMLLIVLVAKSPFMVMAQPQLDGVGLNPLLQDFWMVIHPPILFLGYAGLAVPFAYALEGLFSGNHQKWLTAALPWALFSWCTLGAGMFIGGFWAYKVLGWGGYWAWDPVENSSLVPWLVNGVLVHCLFWARSKPGAIKMAYLASIFSFVSVLYGTFLTRSGVLSDFSTHSFADEGVGSLLAGFVLINLFVGLVMLIIRWPDLPTGLLYSSVNSRDFILGLSVVVLSFMGALVFIGMSTPLITMFMDNPSNVSAGFYNNTLLPLSSVLVILLTLIPMYSNNKHSQDVKWKWWLGLGGFLAAAFAVKSGIYHPMIIASIAFSVMAVLMNCVVQKGDKSLSWPARVTHVGLAIMVIGILVSSVASKTATLSLVNDQPQEALGRIFIYQGVEEAKDGSGFYQNFSIGGQGQENIIVKPFTKYNRDGRPSAREPGIERRLFADLYVAPVVTHEDHEGREVVLRAETESVEQGLTLKFIRSGMVNSGMGQEMKVQAILIASKDGKVEEITPELVYKNGLVNATSVEIFGQYEITINSIKPKDGLVTINLIKHDESVKAQNINVEITHKPFINFVWLGAMLITIGSGWAALQRWSQCPIYRAE